MWWGPMKRLLTIACAAMLQFGCAAPTPDPVVKPLTSQSELKPAVYQGDTWSRLERADYYTVDQGSRIMPLRWFAALKTPDGDSFLDGGLIGRYGYLKNDEAPASRLPVGFTTNGKIGEEWVGMNCAACHTRQIEVGGTKYRIDGGPAISDFQSFLIDLDDAVIKVLNDPAAFAAFARSVLEGVPNDGQLQLLRQQVQAWHKPYNTIVTRALRNPDQAPWGLARLDAVAMIFNRLTGLDIGQGPDHMIPSNIKPADAPVRYPFLWNASRQDFTQWPGFAANGDALLGLARNTGDVIGVFAQFAPYKDPSKLILGVNYADPTRTSINIPGLMRLEQLIERLGPPRWQWAYDEPLRQKGEAIFNWPTAKGGCVECHGIRQGKPRPLAAQPTWATPLLDVGTDSREWQLIGVPGRRDWPGWQVDTGVLAGASLTPFGTALKPVDSAFATLSLAVSGALVQRLPEILLTAQQAGRGLPPLTAEETANGSLPKGDVGQSISSAFKRADNADKRPFKYESRVLNGIWATAPYLHNGSVPTLADLLNPQPLRPKTFKVGSAYDPMKVGLAVEQTGLNSTTTTTGCGEGRISGNSNCGHEFGTRLSKAQKAALLEYLKML